MSKKEQRMIALLEAHEHLSEGIGSYRKGLDKGTEFQRGKLEGMIEAQNRVRNVLIDTALEDYND